MLMYPSEVGPRRFPQDLAAAVGEAREHHPSVAVESASSNELSLHEPVDDPGQPALRHHHSLGEGRHPKRPFRSPSQTKQDVVLVYRQAVLSAQFAIELAGDVVVGVQERLPRSELKFAQPVAHAHSVRPRYLPLQASARIFYYDASHDKGCRRKERLMEVVANTSPVVAALGIGIALAGAPGPVQAVLLTESVRGGIHRGLRALAGVHLTFGCLLVCLALGLSLASPGEPVVRGLKILGGVLLLWLAADGLRAKDQVTEAATGRWSLPPSARGALAILLNPGGWLFLGAVASPLLLTATQQGGRGNAVLAALALVGGAALGDVGVVVLGDVGLRRTGARAARAIRVALAVVLAGLGIWLLLSGARS
jgi:threonine/homoserine/homoserine lactone efflux protein